MIYKQLGVFAKRLVDALYKVVVERVLRDVAHSAYPQLFKPPCRACAHPPEIRDRRVRPQLLPIALLVKLGDANAVLIGRDVLCDNVHSDLCKEHIRAYACRCGYARA